MGPTEHWMGCKEAGEPVHQMLGTDRPAWAWAPTGPSFPACPAEQLGDPGIGVYRPFDIVAPDNDLQLGSHYLKSWLDRGRGP